MARLKKATKQLLSASKSLREVVPRGNSFGRKNLASAARNMKRFYGRAKARKTLINARANFDRATKI